VTSRLGTGKSTFFTVWAGDGVHLTSNATRVAARRLIMETEKGGGTEEPSNKRARLESVMPARAVQQTQPKAPPPAAPKPVATLLWLSGQLPAAQRGWRPAQRPTERRSVELRHQGCRPLFWNRNRRYSNFLPSGTGTGTVSCQNVGTRTGTELVTIPEP
jgi:hypothetical protein